MRTKPRRAVCRGAGAGAMLPTHRRVPNIHFWLPCQSFFVSLSLSLCTRAQAIAGRGGRDPEPGGGPGLHRQARKRCQRKQKPRRRERARPGGRQQQALAVSSATGGWPARGCNRRPLPSRCLSVSLSLSPSPFVCLPLSLIVWVYMRLPHVSRRIVSTSDRTTQPTACRLGGTSGSTTRRGSCRGSSCRTSASGPAQKRRRWEEPGEGGCRGVRPTV